MNTKRFLQYSFVLAGLLTLSACAGGGSRPNVGNTAPPPAAEVAPEVPLSAADKLATALVGTTWEGNVTIANCVKAPVALTFVDWAYNMDLMRVLAVSDECPVLQGGFLGSIVEGKLAVRSFDKGRRILLTLDSALQKATGQIELGIKKNIKADVTFYRVSN